MEILKNTQKIKCDIQGCKNMADYTLKLRKVFFGNSHYCKDCLSALYEQIGKNLIPKPPQTPFKTKKTKS